MTAQRAPSGEIDYRSWRRGTAPELASQFGYRADGAAQPVEPGSLEFFLVERYLLFASGRHGLLSGRVHHPPYAVAPAETTTWDSHLIKLAGFPPPSRPPDHALVSPGVDVEIFAIQRA